MKQAYSFVAPVALATALFCACSASTTNSTTPDGVDAQVPAEDATPSEVDASDATAAVDAKPTGQCAATFGNALTAGFGRIDGIVYAVQKPSDTACVFPNDDHVIVQVLMGGAVYRLVVNVQGSSSVDPKIRIGILPHALPAPAFADGWHLNAGLDYVSTLDAHIGASFTPLLLADAVTKIANELKIGDPVSIYGTSGDGRPESAHLIHRNATNHDGAIVVNPTTAPRFMLFHFVNQTF